MKLFLLIVSLFRWKKSSNKINHLGDVLRSCLSSMFSFEQIRGQWGISGRQERLGTGQTPRSMFSREDGWCVKWPRRQGGRGARVTRATRGTPRTKGARMVQTTSAWFLDMS